MKHISRRTHGNAAKMLTGGPATEDAAARSGAADEGVKRLRTPQHKVPVKPMRFYRANPNGASVRPTKEFRQNECFGGRTPEG
ncbi:MAG: hypothetical protein Q8R13_03990 [bacterium]|nr:hypothetical protein [bacterium]